LLSRPGSKAGLQSKTRPTTVEIESLDSAGDGVARLEGRRISIPFTIPGERVRIRVDARRGERTAATPVEIIRSSPHRVRPLCPYFAPAQGDACGSCAWQHIAYEEQLRIKTARLAQLVRDVVPSAPMPLPMIAGTPIDHPWQYRHKVHFVFGLSRAESRGLPRATSRESENTRGGELVIGHYARGSRRIVPVDQCPVHDDRGNAIAFALHRACVATRAGRTLKSVAVRVAPTTSETLATLVVTNTADKALRTATTAVIEDDAAPTALHINVHPARDAYIFGPETRRIAGPARIREDLAGVSFLMSPTAFFQTNVRAAEELVRLVLAEVPAGSTVLDLYAGAGLFAIPLAKRGHVVTAIEENRVACDDGIASRELSRIPEERCRFIAAPVERALGVAERRPRPGAGRRRARGPRVSVPDVVVLDPPREGCSRAVLNAVFGERSPRTAVYVSCNPETLARDLAIIAARGYAIRSIQPVDMFPHTPHIEAVVVLEQE
jgi:23S rRNA (uracil1939-C5)-methyltransferase